MAKRRNTVDESQSVESRRETAAEHPADLFRQRLEALGLSPHFSYVESDDAKFPAVTEAHDEYRRRWGEFVAASIGQASPSDSVSELLEDCYFERLVALQLRNQVAVDWQSAVTALWARMDAIAVDSGETRPERPIVHTAEQTLDAINTVVRWCEERNARKMRATHSPNAAPPKQRKRPGRKSETERDAGWLATFESGGYKSEAEFARQQDQHPDTMRKALARARKRRKELAN